MVTPSEIEASADMLSSVMCDATVLARFVGQSEVDITSYFEKCFDQRSFDGTMTDEELSEIRRLTYEKLDKKLTERWAHIIVPDQQYIH